VSALKPDPAAYLLALARLGVPARMAVAVVDSRNGLRAALAAGLACCSADWRPGGESPGPAGDQRGPAGRHGTGPPAASRCAVNRPAAAGAWG
jgi:beta-phosphoglucomutase-like phosphatase (HAD superfamily)